jgi:hypothetical protein
MKANQEAMKACLGKMVAMDFEANPEKKKSVVVHEEVPKEEATVKTVRALKEAVWGPASNCRVPPTAAETDPGQWWVPEEVGHCL